MSCLLGVFHVRNIGERIEIAEMSTPLMKRAGSESASLSLPEALPIALQSAGQGALISASAMERCMNR